MPIFDYDNTIVGEQLTPPILRNNKFLAWLNVITKPIGDLWKLVFSYYKDKNSIYSDYDNLTTYNFGDLVKWTDNSIYQATYTNTIGVAESFNGTSPSNTLFWTKILDNYIGVDERIKYNSQIILMEYYLNKWYNVDSLSDQIYIENNTNISSVFVMGESSIYSSSMPISSTYSLTYMGLSPSFPDTTYDYIVWIHALTWADMGDNDSNRENNLRGFLNKYNLSGITYKIDTY